MGDPKRIEVRGPLAAYRDGFADELATLGYTPGSAMKQMWLMAHLSRWLGAAGLGVCDLTPEGVNEFVDARRAMGYTALLSERALAPLLFYLRRLGLSPVAVVAVPTSAAERLVEEYRFWLECERGLAASSVERYVGAVGPFVSQCEGDNGLDLEALTAGHVTAFVVRQCFGCRAGSGKVLVSALRSLLRFLFLEGRIPSPLAQAVPSSTGWAGRPLPRGSSAAEVAALLAGCDRLDAWGRGGSPSYLLD